MLREGRGEPGLGCRISCGAERPAVEGKVARPGARAQRHQHPTGALREGGGEADVVAEVGGPRRRGRPRARSSPRPACRHPPRSPLSSTSGHATDRRGSRVAGAKLSSTHVLHLPGPAARSRAPMTFDLPLAIGGLLVGIARRASPGWGAVRVMTPMLVFLFGVDPLTAISSDIVVSLLMRPIGARRPSPARDGQPAARRVAVRGLRPGGVLGAWLISLVPPDVDIDVVLQRGLGLALLIATAGLITRALIQMWSRQLPLGEGVARHPRRPAVIPKPVPTILLGAAAGFMVGLTSVGAGSIVVVGLLMMHPGLQASALVGTDLVQAIPHGGLSGRRPPRVRRLLVRGRRIAPGRRHPGDLARGPDLHPRPGRHHPARPGRAAALVVAQAPGVQQRARGAGRGCRARAGEPDLDPDPQPGPRSSRPGRGRREGPPIRGEGCPRSMPGQRRRRSDPAAVVLDEDGLDLLELALGGALPAPPVPDGVDPGQVGVVLADAENTPLARLSVAGSGTLLEPLRPFARHGGPQWDPELRLSAGAARARIGSGGRRPGGARRRHRRRPDAGRPRSRDQRFSTG